MDVTNVVLAKFPIIWLIDSEWTQTASTHSLISCPSGRVLKMARIDDGFIRDVYLSHVAGTQTTDLDLNNLFHK